MAVTNSFPPGTFPFPEYGLECTGGECIAVKPTPLWNLELF